MLQVTSSQIQTPNTVELFSEAFGDIENPAIILIMGATAQGKIWPDFFCSALAESGFFVIRYDHRDTGKSSKVDWRAKPYYLEQLAQDIISILDFYALAKASLVGVSMGSFLAQYLAIHMPHRVEKLILAMSSFDHYIFVDSFFYRKQNLIIPGVHQDIISYYELIKGLAITNAEDAERLFKNIWLEVANGNRELLETRVYEGRILRRMANSRFTHNHSYALLHSDSLAARIAQIPHKTLIIHGEVDYILQVEQAIELAKLIQGSELKIYKKTGHYFTKGSFLQLLQDTKKFLGIIPA